ACGSGAFLVAALQHLIKIYTAIFDFIEVSGNAENQARLTKIKQDPFSLDYYIKKRVITDNLYGVDIMEEAVEIAKLRLFLSLVAAAKTVDNLEPLPNVDFNIMSGNSLIGL
ncbi:MAG: DNA methyltransferase, partial [Sphaerospermopsis kisseleviana]